MIQKLATLLTVLRFGLLFYSRVRKMTPSERARALRIIELAINDGKILPSEWRQIGITTRIVTN